MALANRTCDADLEALVTSDQIQILYSKVVVNYFASPINGALYSYVVWNDVSHAIALTWVGSLLIVALVRMFLRRAFLSRPRAPTEALRWARAFATVTAVNGVVWGSSAIFLWVPGRLGAQVLLMLIICGMSAGATALDSNYLPAYWGFTIAEMTPLAVRLALIGDRLHGVEAVLVGVFFLTMSTLARSSERATREASRLRYKNALLVDDLMAARNHLAAMNETLETRVAERTAELKTALAVREEFMSIASHELKTPLTSLKLQLQIMERDLQKASLRIRERSTGRFPVLNRQTARLASLVNTLLDVSRLDADQIPLDLHDVDFTQVVRRVVTDAEEDLRRRGSALTLSLSDSVHGVWDPLRLEQIVANLLSNAAKYGEGKPIAITLEGDNGVARLTVKDRGIGIAEEDLNRIFGKFERAVPSKLYSGFGLGLFVVQQLVRAMHGSVEVHSKLGEGTAFTVQLPKTP